MDSLLKLERKLKEERLKNLPKLQELLNVESNNSTSSFAAQQALLQSLDDPDFLNSFILRNATITEIPKFIALLEADIKRLEGEKRNIFEESFREAHNLPSQIDNVSTALKECECEILKSIELIKDFK